MIYLDNPLYHGTSAHSAILIYGGSGFRAPVCLTEDKAQAEHYAKSATAYIQRLASGKNVTLLKEGYAIFTFTKLPEVRGGNAIPLDKLLIRDDYNPTLEPRQWKYLRSIRSICYSIEYFPLAISQEERIRLECFAIGMWRQ